MFAAAKSLQSCLTLCDPIDSSPPGSPVPGILQARTLEWVAIAFSNAWRWKVKGKSLSRVRLLAIPWTAAYQAPPSMGFSRQEYWSGVPLPSPHLDVYSSFIHYCQNLEATKMSFSRWMDTEILFSARNELSSHENTGKKTEMQIAKWKSQSVRSYHMTPNTRYSGG